MKKIWADGKDNRSFKVTLNSNSSNFKTKLNKTSNALGTTISVRPIEEETYYDEIIYYDGGGVNGWLPNENT